MHSSVSYLCTFHQCVQSHHFIRLWLPFCRQCQRGVLQPTPVIAIACAVPYCGPYVTPVYDGCGCGQCPPVAGLTRKWPKDQSMHKMMHHLPDALLHLPSLPPPIPSPACSCPVHPTGSWTYCSCHCAGHYWCRTGGHLLCGEVLLVYMCMCLLCMHLCGVCACVCAHLCIHACMPACMRICVRVRTFLCNLLVCHTHCLQYKCWHPEKKITPRTTASP